MPCPAATAALRACAAKSVEAIWKASVSTPSSAQLSCTHILRSRLKIRIIHQLRLLAHNAAKPAKTLRQRRHGILRKLIRTRHHPLRTLRLLFRWLATKSRIFPPLTGRQIIRTIGIPLPHPGKIRLILRLLLRRNPLSLRLQLRLPQLRRRRTPRPTRSITPPPHGRALSLLPLFPQHLLPLRPPLILIKLPLFHQRRQSLLPLLPDLTVIPLFNGRLLKRRRRILREEILPLFISPVLHPRDLGLFEGVHADGPHEGDVYAETAMEAGASEADEGREFGRGLFSQFVDKHVFHVHHRSCPSPCPCLCSCSCRVDRIRKEKNIGEHTH